jgi:hypothetical protein
MDNDGRFPDSTRVEVRYPRTPHEQHGDRWLGRGCQLDPGDHRRKVVVRSVGA